MSRASAPAGTFSAGHASASRCPGTSISQSTGRCTFVGLAAASRRNSATSPSRPVSTFVAPRSAPWAARKGNASAPPIRIASARPRKLRSSGSLSATFAPPSSATYGRSGASTSRPSSRTSFSSTNRSPSWASRAAKAGSFASSPGWKRRFSSIRKSPGWSRAIASRVWALPGSSTSGTGWPSMAVSRWATGRRENLGSGWPSGRPRWLMRIVRAPWARRWVRVGIASTIRRSSATAPEAVSGTLKSTRTRTRFPRTIASATERLAIGRSRAGSLRGLRCAQGFAAVDPLEGPPGLRKVEPVAPAGRQEGAADPVDLGGTPPLHVLEHAGPVLGGGPHDAPELRVSLRVGEVVPFRPGDLLGLAEEAQRLPPERVLAERPVDDVVVGGDRVDRGVDEELSPDLPVDLRNGAHLDARAPQGLGGPGGRGVGTRGRREQELADPGEPDAPRGQLGGPVGIDRPDDPPRGLRPPSVRQA